MYDYENEMLELGELPGEGPAPSAGIVAPACPEGSSPHPDTPWVCIPQGGGLPAGFVAPGAVPVRPDNWNADAKPFARYRLASGDTYAGLAATYLGSNTRWREIWDLNRAKHPSADKIFAGEVISMPNEARDNFRKMSGKDDKLKGILPYLAIAAAAGLAAYLIA